MSVLSKYVKLLYLFGLYYGRTSLAVVVWTKFEVLLSKAALRDLLLF
jgi:hypothetical protein